MHPKAIAEAASEYGPQSMLITSDYFFDWTPPAAEGLRMLLGTLLDLGVPDADLRMMVRDVPLKLLGRS